MTCIKPLRLVRIAFAYFLRKRQDFRKIDRVQRLSAKPRNPSAPVFRKVFDKLGLRRVVELRARLEVVRMRRKATGAFPVAPRDPYHGAQAVAVDHIAVLYVEISHFCQALTSTRVP